MKLAVTSHPVGVPEKSRDPQQKAAFFEVSPEDCPTWVKQPKSWGPNLSSKKKLTSWDDRLEIIP
jgi:hypothetical protein